MNTKIQSKSKRQQYVNLNMRQLDNPTVDHRIPFENHAWNSILAWTNINNTKNPLSKLDSLNLPIANQIRPETLQRWKLNLEHAGYNVVINSKNLNISL